jgi:hypothetical protein
MKKTLCAGMIALAALGVLPAMPAANAGEYTTPQLSQVSIDIGRIHSALQLTAEQEAYWPPVEMALRDLARQQSADENAGFVRRLKHRVVSIVLNSAAIERLVVAARPLIARLSDDQKRAAGGMAQQMGLGPVLAALN